MFNAVFTQFKLWLPVWNQMALEHEKWKNRITILNDRESPDIVCTQSNTFVTNCNWSERVRKSWLSNLKVKCQNRNNFLCCLVGVLKNWHELENLSLLFFFSIESRLHPDLAKPFRSSYGIKTKSGNNIHVWVLTITEHNTIEFRKNYL